MEEKSKNSIKTTKRIIGKPFEKGKTGNPEGRPLGQKNYTTLYREALIRLAKMNDKEPAELELELISKGIMSARGGDYRFYKDILDRLFGTALNKTDMTSGGEKIIFMPSEVINKHELPQSPE